MYIKDETWEIFQVYLDQAIAYFESLEEKDYEETTIRDQLANIYFYDPEEEEE